MLRFHSAIGLRAILAPCLLGAAAIPALALPPAPQAREARSATEIIAIGDIHGAHDEFTTLLRSLGLIDASDRWSGGKLRLVQTGDVLDRGDGSRRSLDLLMRLEKEAEPAGGSVTVLLGNHEVMNLIGDLRYVTPGEFAAFAGEEDEELRRSRLEEITALVEKPHALLRSAYYKDLRQYYARMGIERLFPPGYFAHRRAFAADGKYGSWLLERSTAHVDGSCLFVHAGLSPRFAHLPPKAINELIVSELRSYFAAVSELEKLELFDSALGVNELQLLYELERRAGGPHPDLAPLFRKLGSVLSGPLFAADGPIWYRGLATNEEALFLPQVQRILKLQGVKRMVIGHTQDPSLSIKTRFGGAVVLIDTGMNARVYSGRATALRIDSRGNLSPFE